MLDLSEYRRRLEEACRRYEKSAPTVEAHCNELFVRMHEAPQKVTLAELKGVSMLWADGSWAPPNHAANFIYKLRHSLGMDTTGHAGF